MTDRNPPVLSRRNLILLSLTAGIPRIIGALLIHKQPFGDAYCYIEQASMLRGKMITGTLSIVNLHGFWLPLYQFVCAIISLAFNQPFYVAKLVSAVAGAVVLSLALFRCFVLTARH